MNKRLKEKKSFDKNKDKILNNLLEKYTTDDQEYEKEKEEINDISNVPAITRSYQVLKRAENVLKKCSYINKIISRDSKEKDNQNNNITKDKWKWKSIEKLRL